jgi:hypothetical protein
VAKWAVPLDGVNKVRLASLLLDREGM